MGWINPATQTVQAISQQGSLSGGSVVATIGTGTIAPVVLADVSNYATYDLSMYAYATTPGTASSPIVMGVQLYWFDDQTSNIPVFSEQWYIWVGRTTASVSFGIYGDAHTATGPMHGRYMTVVLGNPAGASTITLQYFNLFGSPRPTSFSDWRQNANLVNPQNSGTPTVNGLPGSTGYDNLLCNYSSPSLAASAIVFVPINLYAGPYTWVIKPTVAPQFAGICVADNIVAGNVWNLDPVVNVFLPLTATTQTGTGQAPRAPMYLSFQATAGGASSFYFEVTAQQGA